MKKLLIVFSAGLLVFGCTDYKSQIQKLESEKLELINNAGYKDSTINDFIASFNEIEKSMNEVTQKQKLVSTTAGGEINGSSKERILNSISDIDKMLQENKERIAALSRKLKNSSVKIAEFEKMVLALNEQIAVKSSEIDSLNTRVLSLNNTVAELNTKVDTLTQQNSAKAQTIVDQTAKIQTAYYTKGNYKELKTKSIVIKDGGFIGLGKSEVLKQDFDRSAFTTINIMQVTDIPVAAKSVELLTNHPSDSYTLKKDQNNVVSNLVITNPEKFWSSSKYLVLLTN